MSTTTPSWKLSDDGKSCVYCEAVKTGARACDAEGDFYCTRERGHEGSHIACGVEGDHILMAWSRER